MKEILVSRFKNMKQSEPSTVQESVDLFEFMDDTSRKAEILALRETEDVKEKKEIKEDLPCITPSGLFSKRISSGLIKHSGYICIDIDAKDNPQITDFERQRDEIAKIKNVAYCALSVSGKGLFCIIPIVQPDLHKEYFQALKWCFGKLGIVIDKNCSDVTRLRVCTYDPKRYRNEEEAIPFYKVLEDMSLNKGAKKKRDWESNNRKISKSNNVEKIVRDIVAKIEEKCIDITDDYDVWLKIAFAFANEFGEGGRELFHIVSQCSPKYKSGETDSKYTSCLNSSAMGPTVTIGTFFYIAKNHGLI